MFLWRGVAFECSFATFECSFVQCDHHNRWSTDTEEIDKNRIRLVIQR